MKEMPHERILKVLHAFEILRDIAFVYQITDNVKDFRNEIR